MSDQDFQYEDHIARIAIRNHSGGDINVRPSEDDSTRLVLDSNDDGYLRAMSISQSGDQLVLTFPDGRYASVEIDLEVVENVDLEVSTGSGEVTVGAPLGAAKISTGSGDVDIATVDNVQVSTGSGEIVIGDIGGAGQLNSGSGDISTGSAGAALQAKTASGDLSILKLTGALRANTASGDISVPHAGGSVELRSASGDLSVGVAEQLPAWLDLSSVSGEVSIDLDASAQPPEGEPYVAIKASTASGDISIYRA